MMFKARASRFFIFVAIACLQAGCSADKTPAKGAEAVDAGIVAVARGKIDTRKGVLDVFVPVEGEVASLTVTEGMKVKKGQELLRLQPTAAELDLSLLQAEISQAQMVKKSQQESLERLSRQTRRLQEAANLGAFEMQKVDDALAQQKQAEAALASAEASLKILDRRQAILQWQLQRLVLKAPSDGQVLKINVQPGSRAGAGKPVLSYLPTGALIVRAEVNESYVPELKEGMVADIVVEFRPGNKPVSARLTQIGQIYRAARLDDESQVRANVRVLDCVLEFDQPPDFRVGQNVRVSFRK